MDCIIFGRFSHSDQRRGASLERQIEENIAYCESKGWTVESVRFDRGRSGFHGDHRKATAEFGKLEAEILAGEHDGKILLVERFDRLTRQSPQVSWDLIRSIINSGVSLATRVNDKFYPARTELPMFELLEVLFRAFGDNEESAKKSLYIARQWSKRLSVAKATKTAVTRLAPAWIVVEHDRTMRLDKERAELIRRWAEMCEAGQGYQRIATAMTREAVLTWQRFANRTARVWQRTFIQKVLTNRALVGEFQPMKVVNGKRVPDGEPWPNHFPAVLTEEQFARINNAAPVRKAAARAMNSATVANLLSGLVTCRECGEKLQYKRGRRAGMHISASGRTYVHKRPTASLVCPKGSLGPEGGCSNRAYLAYLTFEDAILDACLHIALDDSTFSNRGEVGRLNVTIAERERALELATSTFMNLKREWAQKPTDLRKRMADEAEAELENLDANLAALRAQRDTAMGRVTHEEHLLRVADLREALYCDDVEQRAMTRQRVKQGLHSIITGIEADPDGMLVTVARGLATIRIDRRGRAHQPGLESRPCLSGPFSSNRPLLLYRKEYQQDALTTGANAENAGRVVSILRRDELHRRSSARFRSAQQPCATEATSRPQAG